MMRSSNERTPLLGDPRNSRSDNEDSTDQLDQLERYAGDRHMQFCILTGVPPSNLPKDAKRPKPHTNSLYERSKRMRNYQSRTYFATSWFSDSLLLSQIVLGAALTGLGASDSSRIAITIFGALNTIIAGIIAYIKSRGQPMRARMFRDDLERVVDEIENSEVMWLGIQRNFNGYSEIEQDDTVSVRSEVARLTRLYDKAIRNSAVSNPDYYHSGDIFTNLHTTPTPNIPQLPIPAAAPNVPAPAPEAPPATSSSAAPVAAPPPVPAPVVADPDESPASAKPKPKPKEDEGSKSPKAVEDKKEAPSTSGQTEAKPSDATSSTPASGPAPSTGTAQTSSAPPLASDVDEGPVTAASGTSKGDGGK